MMSANEIFVARPGAADVFAERDRSQFRWLKLIGRIQDILLLAFLAFVVFLPQNVMALGATFLLACYWGFAIIVGGWHAIKVPASRRKALRVVAAFPLTTMLILLLSGTVGIPIVNDENGGWLFYVALLAFPIYWLGRWLIRATKPQPTNPVPARFTSIVFLAVAVMLMLQGFALIGVVLFGDSLGFMKNFFGGDWFSGLVIFTLGAAVLLAIVALPYTILSIVRGTGNKGTMIGSLICTAISIACTFGILAWVSIMVAAGS